MGRAVQCYVYDMTGGMAKTLGRLAGLDMEGIWHSSLVFGGVEHFYGEHLDAYMDVCLHWHTCQLQHVRYAEHLKVHWVLTLLALCTVPFRIALASALYHHAASQSTTCHKAQP